MLPPDVDAMAGEVVALIKSALAPVQARLAALEQRPIVAPAPDVAPDDIAASVAGLLKKELADLQIPARPLKRIVKDGEGNVKFAIEDTA